jgi:hypothetical protein
VRQCKDKMVPIRTNINAMKELHAKIITEVSQTKSKGGRGGRGDIVIYWYSVQYPLKEQ